MICYSLYVFIILMMGGLRGERRQKNNTTFKKETQDFSMVRLIIQEQAEETSKHPNFCKEMQLSSLSDF